MSNQSYATWANAKKAAGTSDARQVRQVLDMANLITYETYPLLALLGGTEYSMNGEIVSKRSIAGKIASKSVRGLTPELYDYEIAPSNFRLTADTAGVAEGDSVALNLDKVSGIIVGSILNKVDQNVTLRVTAINSSTQVQAKVIKNLSGGTPVILTSDANVAYFEKLGTANADAATVGNGSNQEPINRTNNLQFYIEPFTQGILQSKLDLYASGNNDFEKEKMRKMIEVQAQRERNMIAGRKATEGSGESRILYADGLLGLAESAYPVAGDGTLTEDEFNRGLMPMIRQGGGSMEVYMLCGTDVVATLTGFSRSKIQTKSGDDKYSSVVRTLETTSGIVHLIPHAMFDQAARRGTAIAFQPNYLTRCYLEGLDMQVQTGLNLGNELVDRAAIMACECLLASNPKSITVISNILK